MKKIISILIFVMILFATNVIGAFGDFKQEFDITPIVFGGTAESFFRVGNEWHSTTIVGGSQQFITQFDNDFNILTGNVLEHFDETSPSFLFNSGGAYNGTHYFILRRNVGAFAYVYDNNFNFVQNISMGSSADVITFNGSTFLGVNGNVLRDMGSGLKGATVIFSDLETGFGGGVAQVGSILYVADEKFDGDQISNVTSYNTSNGFLKSANKFSGIFGEAITGLGANESNVIIHGGTNKLLDSNLNLISTFEHQTQLGATNPRSLTFDGTNWWLVERNNNFWWKYDTNLIPISRFSIATNGSNWRSGTVIGNNLYAYEQGAGIIHVWTRNGTWNFSFDPDPFPNFGLSRIRGMFSNGTHLFINNRLGSPASDGSDIGIFESDGTYTGINITLSGIDTGDRQTVNPDFTPSTDIVAIGADGGSDPVANFASLLRYNGSTGILKQIINFSVIPINASFPYGLDYLEDTNEIYILPRFAVPDESNTNNVVVLDGGTLNISAFVEPPPAPSVEAEAEGLPLSNVVQIAGMVALFLIVLTAILGRKLGKKEQ